jgi:3-methyladenine DNA glycosylase/8-oxoguanine DNA glycosylase
VVEDVVTPRGPYRLRLVARSGRWTAPLVTGDASAWQRADGRVVLRAPDEDGLRLARFMLALDDDTAEFHRRFRSDPLLGATSRVFVGYRPQRVATVAHALLRAFCGQLIDARRARTIERRIARAADGGAVATQAGLRRLSAAMLRRHGLAQHRASGLARVARGVDLERLRAEPTPVVLRRLGRERGIGPWSVGVVALEGLGRYDHGLIGDLGLVEIATALWRRPVEGWETAELLAPYGQWQGLASELLMLGAARRLVPGVDPDAARLVRVRARRAA